MWEDPNVAEVHRTRERLAAQFNFDIAAMFADIRKRQTALGSRLISLRKGVGPETTIPEGARVSETIPSNACER